jgi:tetratricopeptide (TPR) repeat protein
MNYFQKALSYDGQYIAAIKEMGAIYAVNGDLDKAASSFKKIVGLRPENAEACYWLAGIFAVQHKTDEAVGWLENAVNRGYQDWGRLKTDRKLKNIRHTTYYKKLMYNRSS